MKVLWICGLPEDVRLNATAELLTEVRGAAWSWIVGHLPPSPNVELHILCPVLGLKRDRMDFCYLGAHWHCFRQRHNELAFFWLRFYLTTRIFVKTLSPEVIHGWGGETGCGWLSTLFSRCAVVSVQGLLVMFRSLMEESGRKVDCSIRARMSSYCESWTYKRAKICLVESEASRGGLMKYYRREGEIVPHPLRKEFLDLNLEHRHSLANGPMKFVFVGSLCERKGALDAVRAFIEVNNPKWTMTMIGDGPLRPLINEVYAQSKCRGTLYIKQDLSPSGIANEFCDAQFFLLPSYGDTGPTALKEALSCGLYPICYDNSGPSDLIKHYECGRLIKTGCVQELSRALLTCAENCDKCLAVAAIASLKVREELSKESVWNTLLTYYSRIVG